MKLPKLPLRYWVALLVVWAGWLAAAYVLVPELISAAYRGESFELLNRMISGQQDNALDAYLRDWSALAARVSLWLGVSTVVLVAGFVFRDPLRRLGRRFLIGAPPAKPMEVSEVLGVALTVGIAVGALEAAGVLARKAGTPNWEEYTSDVVWMAPMAGGAALLLAGLGIVTVTALHRPVRTPRNVVFLLATLAAYGLVRSLQLGILPWAAAVVAVGVGANLAGLAARGPARLRTLARRGPGLALGLLLGLGLIDAGVEWAGAHRAGDDAQADRGAPNVLLLILDTVRRQSLSVYGYPRETTPNLDRFAERGVVFQNAIATSPWTLPSHASVFSGRDHVELEGDWMTPFRPDGPTLPEVLASRGYETAAFVGNYFYAGRRSGLDRGFAVYDDDPVGIEAVVSNYWMARALTYGFMQRRGNQQILARRTAESLNERFLKWLDRRGEDPFFAFVNYYDAHTPYLPPEPFNTLFADPQPLYYTWPRRDFSPQEISELVAAYDGSIAYLDHHIGRLFEELDARGTLQNTIVIVTSDHGEQFGETLPGLVEHGNSLYLPNLAVPLVVIPPEFDVGGLRVDDVVSIKDVPSTILELTGALDPAAFPGSSLTRYWSASRDDAPEEAVFSSLSEPPYWTRWDPAALGDMHGVIYEGFHYIRNGDDSEELYHLASDPWEVNDLSPLGEHRDHLSRMRSLVDDLGAGR